MVPYGMVAETQKPVEIASLYRLHPFRRGVPSHDTLSDVPGALNAEPLSKCFTARVGDLRASRRP